MSSTFVTLGRFVYPWQAFLLQIRLEAEGIRAFVDDEVIVSYNWFWGYALGGIKVLVEKTRVEEALKILNQLKVKVKEKEEEEPLALGTPLFSRLFLGTMVAYAIFNWVWHSLDLFF